jgi:hypothetical protein
MHLVCMIAAALITEGYIVMVSLVWVVYDQLWTLERVQDSNSLRRFCALPV